MNVNKAIKSIFVIIVFAFGSKALGFIREALIAAKFGSGVLTDSFFVALTATSLFSSLITQAVKTTTIPILAEIEATEGESGKIHHTNNLLNILLFISFLMVVIGWIVSPAIVKILAIGFKGEQYQFAVLLTRIGLPVVFFSSIVGVYRGFLQSNLMFIESAATQFPYNFTYLLFLVLLSDQFGIIGLMVVSVLAVASQIIIQIPALRKSGYKYKLVFDLKDVYIRKIIHLISPVLMSVGISDVNKIIDRTLGSMLIKGSVSALHYANRIQVLIVELFISAIGTVIFPVLSKEVSCEDQTNLKKTIVSSINVITLITIPATFLIISLAEPIVRIAFQRGAFDEVATNMTKGAVVFYIIGLTSMSINFVIQKVYYAFQDTKAPMVNSFYSMIINVIISLLLAKKMGHNGLALGTSISGIFMCILLMRGLKKKIVDLKYSDFYICLLKSVIASMITAVIAIKLYTSLIRMLIPYNLSEVGIILFTLIITGLVYFVIINFLRIEEIEWLKKIVRNKFKLKRL